MVILVMAGCQKADSFLLCEDLKGTTAEDPADGAGSALLLLQDLIKAVSEEIRE